MKPYAISFLIILGLSFQHSLAQIQAIPQLGHNSTIIALQYSPDGKYLATAGHDRVVLLWDTKTNLHWPLHGHAVGVEKLAFSPDSKYLISTDFAGNLIVWDLSTRKILNRITNNADEHAFFKIQFLNNDEVALLNGKMFRFWNFKTNTVTKKIPLKATYFTLHPKEPTVLLLEQTSSLSTSSGFTQTHKMILYNINALSPLDDSWIRNIGATWTRAEFSSSGKYLALLDAGQLVMLDYAAKKLLWRINVEAPFQSMMITPDESKVIISGNMDQPDLFIYDRATGKQLQRKARFTDFNFAYNHQQQLVAGSLETSEDAYDVQSPISIYDLKSQVIIKTYQYSNYTAELVAWNDATQQLYVKGYKANWVWDAGLGNIMETNDVQFQEEVASWKKGTVKIPADGGSTYLSPARKYSAKVNASSGAFEVKDLKTGQSVFSGAEGSLVGLAFAHDNSKLYRSSPDDLFVYDLTTKQQINQLHYKDASIGYLACSADGKYLAVGKYQNEYTEIKEKFYVADFTIDLLDPKTLQVIRKLEGHSNNVTSLDFTPDNKYLISSSLDGSIRFWDPNTGKTKFTLYGDSPDEYFIQADNGFYSSSKSGIDRIAFDYKGSIIPGKLFETQMNRPDKVVEAMGYSTPNMIAALRKAFEKRIAQLGITEQQLKVEELPQLIATNLPAPSVNKKTIQINYEALDNLNELNNIKLLVNNVPVYGRKGLSVKTKKSVKGKLDIELTEGKNTVELSVVNAKGASSIPVTFDVFCTVKTQPDLYLLTIGVDKFLEQDYNLNYAAKDAADIAALFESKKSSYGKFVHLPFTGIQATKENILAVRSTLEKTRPDDQVIIFVATHGLLDEKFDYFLATYNMMFEKPAFQGLAYNDLEGMLDGIPARRKLILLDACHSGEVDAAEVTASTEAVKHSPGMKVRGFKPVKKTSNVGYENTFDLMKNLFADLREGTGTTVISSAGGVEFAIESDEWNNGAFTAAILEGIKTKHADANKDAAISVGELKSYVFKRVVEMTNGKQHPTSRIDNIDNDFNILSTMTGGSTAEIDLAGTWVTAEMEDQVSKQFEPVKPGDYYYRTITVTKGVDGNYYVNMGGAGDIKLTPEDKNEYGGPGGWTMKAESETSMVKYDSYMGNMRYKKVN